MKALRRVNACGARIGGVSETVLIVDDHAGFRRFARLLLEAGGLTVVGEVGDGGSAVETVRELAPDLVVLDVLLPDMDGFVVAEQIAADNPRVRVVLTSSREREELRARLERSRARGFIPKAELSAERVIAVAGVRR